MYQFVFVIVGTVSLILLGLQILMMIRALLSWFPPEEDNAFLRFVFFVTEIVVLPLRVLFDRLGWFEGMPIDMAFLISFLSLSILRLFL